MQPPITQTIEEIKARKVSRKNKKKLELKILSALLYFYEISLRRASKFIPLFDKNKPEIVVDRGFWYRRVLERLGLDYKHETFGERNAVEGFFSERE